METTFRPAPGGNRQLLADVGLWDMDTLERVITEWQEAAGAEAYFSASRVQDRLFEVYGEVDEAPAAKRLVETWLTLTVQRDMFSGAELQELLGELRSRLADPVPSR